jgi:hypothetical protein
VYIVAFSGFLCTAEYPLIRCKAQKRIQI